MNCRSRRKGRYHERQRAAQEAKILALQQGD
jgi:hypothetical protein